MDVLTVLLRERLSHLASPRLHTSGQGTGASSEALAQQPQQARRKAGACSAVRSSLRGAGRFADTTWEAERRADGPAREGKDLLLPVRPPPSWSQRSIVAKGVHLGFPRNLAQVFRPRVMCDFTQTAASLSFTILIPKWVVTIYVTLCTWWHCFEN